MRGIKRIQELEVDVSELKAKLHQATEKAGNARFAQDNAEDQIRILSEELTGLSAEKRERHKLIDRLSTEHKESTKRVAELEDQLRRVRETLREVQEDTVHFATTRRMYEDQLRRTKAKVCGFQPITLCAYLIPHESRQGQILTRRTKRSGTWRGSSLPQDLQRIVPPHAAPS